MQVRVIADFVAKSDVVQSPVAARSNASVCGRSLTGTVGFESLCSNLSLVSILRYHVDFSKMGPSLVQKSPIECVVCLSVIVKLRKWGDLCSSRGCHAMGKKKITIIINDFISERF
jgi:hypothetical protein